MVNVNLPAGFGKTNDTAQILIGVAVLGAIGVGVYLVYKLTKPIVGVAKDTGQTLKVVLDTSGNIMTEAGETVTKGLDIVQTTEMQANKAIDNIGKGVINFTDIYHGATLTAEQIFTRAKQAGFKIGHNILDWLHI